MMKGYAKADEASVAWSLFGALTGMLVGEAVSKRGKKVKPAVAAGIGAVAGLGTRAFVDPDLVAERQQG